jgi:hypothetical protein
MNSKAKRIILINERIIFVNERIIFIRGGFKIQSISGLIDMI